MRVIISLKRRRGKGQGINRHHNSENMLREPIMHCAFNDISFFLSLPLIIEDSHCIYREWEQKYHEHKSICVNSVLIFSQQNPFTIVRVSFFLLVLVIYASDTFALQERERERGSDFNHFKLQNVQQEADVRYGNADK